MLILQQRGKMWRIVWISNASKNALVDKIHDSD